MKSCVTDGKSFAILNTDQHTWKERNTQRTWGNAHVSHTIDIKSNNISFKLLISRLKVFNLLEAERL